MSSRQRKRLVERLEATGAIRSSPVRDAFIAIPREAFIRGFADDHGIEAVYRDKAIPTKADEHGDAVSSSSQPGVMAAMLEESRLAEGQRVLEIGAGTGYNAALLSVLVGPAGRVTSVELDPDVARAARRAVASIGRRAKIVSADGRSGWEPDAPYDRIIVTASSSDVPRAFAEQLKDGGLLVMPLRLSDAVPFRQIVVTFERVGRSLTSISVVHGGFMRLRDRPDDPSLPWPASEVVEMSDGARRVLASLSGSTWGALTADARSALLGLALTTPRSRAIGIRVSGGLQWGLESFLVLAVPEDRLVGYARSDLGDLLYFTTAMPAVVDVGPHASLAHLAGRKALSRIEAYGGRRSERLLADLVDEWRGQGRPGVSRLHVEVLFRRRGPFRTVWRSRRRGSSTLLFDWR